MSLKVKDVMVKDVITVEADYTVKYAAKTMNRMGIGCLIVLEKGKVVGILTERDLLKKIVAVAKDPEKTFVKDIMSRPVFVVRPDAPLEEAVEMMYKKKIKKLPVMEDPDKNKRLVGLVTLTDICRFQPKIIKTLKKLFGREAPPESMQKVINYYIV
jgi:CBS-domain-containing membrane protein